MNASPLQLRKRIITVALLLALSIGAFASYPLLTTGASDANANANALMDSPAIADPQLGTGGGGGGG